MSTQRSAPTSIAPSNNAAAPINLAYVAQPKKEILLPMLGHFLGTHQLLFVKIQVYSS